MAYLLEIEALDLGPGTKAVGLELTENDENREPVRGPEAARIWSRVLPATAGQEPWALDFFSHLERVRDFCDRHEIAYREASARSLVIPAPASEALESLLDRFQAETFGARAGGVLPAEDPALEGGLAQRGVDAYDKTFPNYFFCAVCGFENGSLVILSEKLWASEVIRRVRPALKGLEVEILLPA
ncbi:MAG TPA: hypothetical protein VL913_00010 [Candidatus Micrarchaeaceae archaeon]|nr:hypothetical protein [Candidatus Micrarchaeaceae archaeon]